MEESSCAPAAPGLAGEGRLQSLLLGSKKEAFKRDMRTLASDGLYSGTESHASPSARGAFDGEGDRASDCVSSGLQARDSGLYASTYTQIKSDDDMQTEADANRGAQHSSIVAAFEIANKLASYLRELPHQLRHGAAAIQTRTESTAVIVVRRFGGEALFLVVYAILGVAAMIGVTCAVNSKGYFRGAPRGLLHWHSFFAKTLFIGATLGVLTRFLRSSFAYWERRIEAHQAAGSSRQVVENMRQILSFLLALGWLEAWTAAFLLELFGAFSFLAFCLVLPLATLLRAVGRAALFEHLRSHACEFVDCCAPPEEPLDDHTDPCGAAEEDAEEQHRLQHHLRRQAPRAAAAYAGGEAPLGGNLWMKALFAILGGSMSFFGPSELQGKIEAGAYSDDTIPALGSSLLASPSSPLQRRPPPSSLFSSLRRLVRSACQLCWHAVDGFFTFQLCAVLALLFFHFDLARFFCQNAIFFSAACVATSHAAPAIDALLENWRVRLGLEQRLSVPGSSALEGADRDLEAAETVETAHRAAHAYEYPAYSAAAEDELLARGKKAEQPASFFTIPGGSRDADTALTARAAVPDPYTHVVAFEKRDGELRADWRAAEGRDEAEDEDAEAGACSDEMYYCEKTQDANAADLAGKDHPRRDETGCMYTTSSMPNGDEEGNQFADPEEAEDVGGAPSSYSSVGYPSDGEADDREDAKRRMSEHTRAFR
ncbi:hypothetical protein BESB_062320 [Besnoitia besnoiti]|uniref:Transmembrane protein n=1 Tax=Besnoitia besnoiti TaxID=94643 RepID=A0A2A9MBK4_BESBE|nr:hypothetical protein BESB_062320 [Besnoitia besnoiti]PFH35345.1 hypothetical protein BESB_062320 [Besnoitia besnoiti]